MSEQQNTKDSNIINHIQVSQQYFDIIDIFTKYISQNITEIFINKAGELITENIKGEIKYYQEEKITADTINTLLLLTGNITNREISYENPTISSKIPLANRKERISGIWGTFTENHCCLSIRMQKEKIIKIRKFFTKDLVKKNDPLKKLQKIFQNQNINIIKKIKEILINNQNIIISGGTGTGKTSFLNSIISEAIPKNTRIITIENAREIFLNYHKNKLHIISGDTQENAKHILNIILRLKPSWIVLGEIGIHNASFALNYAQTGHPVATTIHGGDPKEAIQRLAQNIMQTTSHQNIQILESMLTTTFPFVIQISTYIKDNKKIFHSKLYEINYSIDNKIQKKEII